MDSKFEKAIDFLNEKRTESGVDINGKLYSMVKDRIEVFRKMWGAEYGIETEIDYRDGFGNGCVVVAKAHIINGTNAVVIASGHAMDRVGHDQVSTTAIVEATETAAIGRALACFGLHGGEYASDAEMTAIPRKQEAVRKQEQVPVILTSGLYVPQTNDDAIWNQPHNHIDKVLKTIEKITDVNTLGKYWSELAEFRKLMESQTPDRVAELKATFATVGGILKGQSR